MVPGRITDLFATSPLYYVGGDQSEQHLARGLTAPTCSGSRRATLRRPVPRVGRRTGGSCTSITTFMEWKVRRRSGRNGLWLMDADGSNPARSATPSPTSGAPRTDGRITDTGSRHPKPCNLRHAPDTGGAVPPVSPSSEPPVVCSCQDLRRNRRQRMKSRAISSTTRAPFEIRATVGAQADERVATVEVGGHVLRALEEDARRLAVCSTGRGDRVRVPERSDAGTGRARPGCANRSVDRRTGRRRRRGRPWRPRSRRPPGSRSGRCRPAGLELVDVGMGDRALAGAAGRERQAAHPVRREAHPAHGVGGLLDRLEARDHHALGPEVEGPSDAQAGAFLDARRGRSRRRLEGVDAGQQVGLGQRAVLEVQDDPVEPGPAQVSAAIGEPTPVNAPNVTSPARGGGGGRCVAGAGRSAWPADGTTRDPRHAAMVR